MLRRRPQPRRVFSIDFVARGQPRPGRHQRVHRHPHHGGLRQHEDVRLGRGMWRHHQNFEQLAIESVNHGGIPGAKRLVSPHFWSFKCTCYFL